MIRFSAINFSFSFSLFLTLSVFFSLFFSFSRSNSLFLSCCEYHQNKNKNRNNVDTDKWRFDHFYMQMRYRAKFFMMWMVWLGALKLRAQRNSVWKEFMLIYFCFHIYLCAAVSTSNSFSIFGVFVVWFGIHFLVVVVVVSFFSSCLLRWKRFDSIIST